MKKRQVPVLDAVACMDHGVLFAEKGKRLYDRDGYTFDSLYLKPFRQEMQYNLTVNFYRL